MAKRRTVVRGGGNGARAATGIREGARWFGFATDGLLVFLYDEANRDCIRRLGGAEAVYEAPSAASESQVRQIEQEGLLVACELFGDGRIVLDLAVGRADGRELAFAAARPALASVREALHPDSQLVSDPRPR